MAGVVAREGDKVIEKLKGYIARPQVRSSLYRLALAVAAFLAAKYALDGSLLAIVNGALAVLFGVADANVPAPEPDTGGWPVS